jgi:hypothetical protein
MHLQKPPQAMAQSVMLSWPEAAVALIVNRMSRASAPAVPARSCSHPRCKVANAVTGVNA